MFHLLLLYREQLNICHHLFLKLLHTDSGTYLGSIHADNAVAVACAVVKIGDCDSLFAGRNPVLLRGWINLEDMGPGGVDRLLPGEQRTEQRDNVRGGY